MFEIFVYDLLEILKDYYKIIWEIYIFFLVKKDKFCVYFIYKSCSNILFIMEKSDIFGGIIEFIIVLFFKNGKVE